MSFSEINEPLKNDLKRLIADRTENFQDSYFKPILKKPSAAIAIRASIEKDKQGRFIGKFYFSLDNNDFYYSTSTPFKQPYDVVSHAFRHLKEQLAERA